MYLRAAYPPRCVFPAVLAALCPLVAPLPGQAHPHSWITTTVAPIFDGSGRLAAVHQKWAFDYDYSTVARLQFDGDDDGTVSVAELASALAAGGVLSWI